MFSMIKTIIFKFNSDVLRYKISTNESEQRIDNVLRKRFHIPLKQGYYLVDEADSATVSICSLILLPEYSNVFIELEESSHLSASTNKVEHCDRNSSSFSDNKKKLLLSDISTTTESESDTGAKQNISYHCNVPISDAAKLKIAQDRQKKQTSNTVCNKKIHHFLIKYGQIPENNYYHVRNELIRTLNINKAELYNLLKYTRNTIDMSKLYLDENNIVEILGNIYKDDYSSDC